VGGDETARRLVCDRARFDIDLDIYAADHAPRLGKGDRVEKYQNLTEVIPRSSSLLKNPLAKGLS
jgi:hypothetical protein